MYVLSQSNTVLMYDFINILQTNFGEFDITRIQGSFDGALNGLIHHYLYNSGHYKKFLDAQDFKKCEKVIKMRSRRFWLKRCKK